MIISYNFFFSQSFMSVKNKRYSNSINHAMTIAEMENRFDDMRELTYIYENTSKHIRIALPILEDIYEKSYRREPKMKLYSIGDKEIMLHEIIKALSDAYLRTTIIVARVAKDLNVDIEFDLSKYGSVVQQD